VMWQSTMLAVVAEGGGDMADVEAMRMPLLDPCGRSQRATTVGSGASAHFVRHGEKTW